MADYDGCTDVPCGTCKAPAGQPCTSIMGGGGLERPHPPRRWAHADWIASIGPQRRRD